MNINKCQISPSFNGLFRIDKKDEELAEKGRYYADTSFHTNNDNSLYYVSKDFSNDLKFMAHLNDSGVKFLYSNIDKPSKAPTPEQLVDYYTKSLGKQAAGALMDVCA